MKKDLPELFKGKVFNSVNQAKTVLNKKDENNIRVKEEKIEIEDKSVSNKIKEILNSSEFVYKADVLITLDNSEEVQKTIIGRTNDSLITMDDELIDVSKIIKIELV